jgi:hypothetical protein
MFVCFQRLSYLHFVSSQEQGELTGTKWLLADLTESLTKDPAARIKYNTNEKDPNVQLVVYGSTNFADVVIRLAKEISEGERRIALACEGGEHRAPVVGETLASQLNGIVDGSGKRAYNVQHFKASEYPDAGSIEGMARSAEGWAKAPWALQDEDSSHAKKDLYGYKATVKEQAASRTWMTIYDSVRAMELPKPEAVLQEEEAVVNLTDEHELSPDWATFEQNPHVWWMKMQEWGIDEDGQADLFLLAQHSPEGWRAANSLMAKILKKKSDGEELRKPGAFIHAGCRNARHAIENSYDQKKWRSDARSNKDAKAKTKCRRPRSPINDNDAGMKKMKF